MATTLANPFDMTAATQAWNNLGKPVVNNQGTAQPILAGGVGGSGTQNPFSPTGGTSSPATGGIIGGRPVPTHDMPKPIAYASSSTGAVPVTSTSAGNTTIGGTTTSSPGSQDQLNKQLTDIFGQGVGGLLEGEIQNLGSDNSAYLQAYGNAQAPINAENLATLQTTLSNEGIGANSSAASIAQADFQSQITGQEAQLEQQLTMQDIQNLLGITQGLEKPAEEEVASGSPLSIISSLIGLGGNVAESGLGSDIASLLKSIPIGF